MLRFGIPESALHTAGHNRVDLAFEEQMSRFNIRWPRFDGVLAFFAEHDLLKGGPIVFLAWVAFFEDRRGQAGIGEGRRKLAAVVPMAIAAVGVGRLLADLFPLRARPFRTPPLQFRMVSGLPGLYGWSSFPSDHAILFTALAVGIFFASRRLGIFALTYTVLLIDGPRLLLGIHWPTDILAGAALGVAFASVASFATYRDFVWSWVERWRKSYPGIFAASMFLLCYEITDLFTTPLTLAHLLLQHFRR
jgi:undecaprenyl-diphosphatase